MKKIFILSAFLLFFVLGTNAQNKVVEKYAKNPEIETITISKEMINMLGSQAWLKELTEEIDTKSLEGSKILFCRKAELSKEMYNDIVSNIEKDKHYTELMRETSKERCILAFGKKQGNSYSEIIMVATMSDTTAVVEFVGKFPVD